MNMQYQHFKYKGYGCDLDGTTYSTKGARRKVTHHTGYLVITMYVNKKAKQLREHRFIYECVTGREIPKDMFINHIDGDKSNNKFSNLELVTPSENTRHAFKTGLMKPLVGEANGNSRIDAGIVRNIIRDIIEGQNNTNIGLKYNLDPKHISLIRHKKRWRFIFEEPEFKDYKFSRSDRTGLRKEGSTTIPRGSTTQANGVGSGVHVNT
jgi:hypothetical protein